MHVAIWRWLDNALFLRFLSRLLNSYPSMIIRSQGYMTGDHQPWMVITQQ